MSRIGRSGSRLLRRNGKLCRGCCGGGIGCCGFFDTTELRRDFQPPLCADLQNRLEINCPGVPGNQLTDRADFRIGFTGDCQLVDFVTSFAISEAQIQGTLLGTLNKATPPIGVPPLCYGPLDFFSETSGTITVSANANFLGSPGSWAYNNRSYQGTMVLDFTDPIGQNDPYPRIFRDLLGYSLPGDAPFTPPNATVVPGWVFYELPTTLVWNHILSFGPGCLPNEYDSGTIPFPPGSLFTAVVQPPPSGVFGSPGNQRTASVTFIQGDTVQYRHSVRPGPGGTTLGYPFGFQCTTRITASGAGSNRFYDAQINWGVLYRTTGTATCDNDQGTSGFF